MYIVSNSIFLPSNATKINLLVKLLLFLITIIFHLFNIQFHFIRNISLIRRNPYFKIESNTLYSNDLRSIYLFLYLAQGEGISIRIFPLHPSLTISLTIPQQTCLIHTRIVQSTLE